MQRAIIAPHADDEALGCGGLLARHPDTGVIVLAEPDDVREKEFHEARHVLGYEEHRLLGFRDGYLGQDMHALVGAIDKVLAEWQPDELYLPFPSMHQDHIAAYEAGVRSARLSLNDRHWFPPNVLVYDVAVYDINIYPTDLRWNVFQELSEAEVERKIAALSLYSSQAVDGVHPINGIKELAHTTGGARRLPYAEQYALVREVRR